MAINFKLLRSSTGSKRPTAAQLAEGELALNFSDTTGGLFYENASGEIVKVGPVEISATAPNATPAGSSGNSIGEMWLDTSTSPDTLKIWNGTQWVAVQGAINAAGNDTEVQFNNNGTLAGDANFTFNSADDILSVTEVEGRLDGPVVFQAKSGEALSVGDVVYVSGVSGNFPVVSKAQANSAATMPAMGVTQDAAAAVDDDVTVVTLGTFSNFDTSTPGWSINDTLYVSATTAGAFTDTPPTGEGNLLQNIGKVMRVHASTGRVKIGGAGRTNATPNLNENNIFIGNASNQSSTSAFNTVLAAQAGITVNASDLTLNRSLIPDTDITYDLGTASLRWKDLYLSGSSITLGTNVLTTDGTNLSLDSDVVLTQTSPLMTGNVILDNQATLTFRELTTNGTDYVGLKAPAAVTTSITFTLPGADGTSGQALVTNGSGTLTFSDVAGGVTVSSTAPSSPSAGDLWYNSVDGRMYVYYSDGNSSQWVDANPNMSGAPGNDTEILFNNNGTQGASDFLTIGASTVGVGATILPDTDNTYDLGSTSLRFANIYTGDLHLANDRGDWTVVEEEDALTLRNNKTGKVYNIMMQERV
jgi:hypothetical protein